MTHDEAAQLLDSKHGKLCARLFRRWDGSIVTKDCPRRHRRHLTMAGIGVTLAVASAAGLAASLERQAYMGAIGGASIDADPHETQTIPSYELDDVPIDLGESSEP